MPNIQFRGDGKNLVERGLDSKRYAWYFQGLRSTQPLLLSAGYDKLLRGFHCI